MGPQAETERLQKRFETLRFGRDEYEKDEFLERWNETIQIGEHLLTIYEAEEDRSGWVVDIAYHLIMPYSYQGDYYGHQRRHYDAEHPVDYARAIGDYSRIVELDQKCRSIQSDETVAEVLVRRANCYLQQQDYASALRDADFVVNKIGDGESYALRSRCLLAAGGRQLAGEDAKKAIAAGNFEGFGLYRDCYPQLAEQNDSNLERMLTQYREGKRDFRGIDLSWTSLERRGLQIDLRDCILDGANLSYVGFGGANLAGVKLRGACLDFAVSWRFEDGVSFLGADLTGAMIRDARLLRADFRGAILENANLQRTDLTCSRMDGAYFKDAVLKKTKLTSASLRAVDLSDLDIREAVLAGANMSRACLRNAQLDGSSLWQADLTEVDLRGASLRGANLQEAKAAGANLSNVILDKADCHRVDFADADLQLASIVEAHLMGANVCGANLANANLSASNTSDAQMDSRTKFEGAIAPNGKPFGFWNKPDKYMKR